MVARERRLYHDGAAADVVPSEELRALLLRSYAAWETAGLGIEPGPLRCVRLGQRRMDRGSPLLKFDGGLELS